MKSAIVLCSGGLDSVVTAHYVKTRDYAKIKVLFFNYGQNAVKAERKFSKECARSVGADFLEISLNDLAKNYRPISSKRHSKVSRDDLKDSAKHSKEWYFPGRNLVFLSYALSLAEKISNSGKVDLYVGFKNEGKDSYPDTTKEFVSSFNELIRAEGLKNIQLVAPLIEKDKEDIIELGVKLGVNFTKTTSCYVGNNSCGECLACMLRKEGFYWAGVKDPTSYIKK